MKITRKMLIAIAITGLTAEAAVAMLVQERSGIFGRRANINNANDPSSVNEVPADTTKGTKQSQQPQRTQPAPTRQPTTSSSSDTQRRSTPQRD